MRLTESSIYFKTRRSELEKLSDLSFENEFYLHENKKNHFHISGFALSLALKQRLETALKWPIGWLGGLTRLVNTGV